MGLVVFQPVAQCSTSSGGCVTDLQVSGSYVVATEALGSVTVVLLVTTRAGVQLLPIAEDKHGGMAVAAAAISVGELGGMRQLQQQRYSSTDAAATGIGHSKEGVGERGIVGGNLKDELQGVVLGLHSNGVMFMELNSGDVKEFLQGYREESALQSELGNCIEWWHPFAQLAAEAEAVPAEVARPAAIGGGGGEVLGRGGRRGGGSIPGAATNRMLPLISQRSLVTGLEGPGMVSGIDGAIREYLLRLEAQGVAMGGVGDRRRGGGRQQEEEEERGRKRAQVKKHVLFCRRQEEGLLGMGVAAAAGPGAGVTVMVKARLGLHVQKVDQTVDQGVDYVDQGQHAVREKQQQQEQHVVQRRGSHPAAAAAAGSSEDNDGLVTPSSSRSRNITSMMNSCDHASYSSLLCFSSTGHLASLTLLPDTAAAAVAGPLSKLQSAVEKLQLEHQASKAITRVQLDPQGFLGEYIPGLSNMINEPEEEEGGEEAGRGVGLREQQQEHQECDLLGRAQQAGELIGKAGGGSNLGPLGSRQNSAALDRTLSSASTALVPDNVLPSRLLQCGLSQVHSSTWQLHVKPSLEGLTGLGPVGKGVMEGAAGGSVGDITRGVALGEAPPEVQPLECTGWGIDGDLVGEVLEWLKRQGGAVDEVRVLDGRGVGGGGGLAEPAEDATGDGAVGGEKGLQELGEKVASTWKCLEMSRM